MRKVRTRSFCSIEELVFLKSKRVPISRWAWSTALRTSWRSTSDTTSKLGIAGRVTALYHPQPPATSGSIEGRCPSGQREQTVNLPAYAYGGSNPPRPTRRLSRHGCSRDIAAKRWLPHGNQRASPPTRLAQLPGGSRRLGSGRRPRARVQALDHGADGGPGTHRRLGRGAVRRSRPRPAGRRLRSLRFGGTVLRAPRRPHRRRWPLRDPYLQRRHRPGCRAGPAARARGTRGTATP